ncbi:MAG: FAD-binding oxidoreductase [Sphingomonadales bacterium]|nr:FAD-binding oxidoreductase [Sphingomonadales bacterium]MBD3773717.1 FAD-binding oxidoreductase [Paracoccaceae bacterium]
MDHYDIVVVGAGMAGASLAAELAPHARVLVVEAEDRPGYHATGRSAAFWAESYGGPQVQPLTTASGPWLESHGMLSPRGALTLARTDQAAALEAFEQEFTAAGVRVEMLDRAGIENWVPGVLPQWQLAALEPDCSDIDVAAVHAHYLAQMRKAGAELRLRAPLAEAVREAGSWQVSLGDGTKLACDLVVDAAGAWADVVARRCGVRPLGIQPMRRTVAQLRTAPAAPANLPLVLDIAGEFYFKPEAGKLWLSPHDETPSAPCDAAPEEIDVAIAIDRFEKVVDWRIEAVEHRWAGLRSFAPDRLPVYGRDAHEPGFAWFAGQGGFGIQTAPAAAMLGAAVLLGRALPDAISAVDPELYLPGRFG